MLTFPPGVFLSSASVHVCVLISSYKDTNHVGLGFMPPLALINFFFKDEKTIFTLISIAIYYIPKFQKNKVVGR